MLSNIKIFIIHVSSNIERFMHMEEMLKKINLPYQHEYINEGDMSDITEEILDRYFCDKPDCKMHLVAPRVSCCLKHVIAYQKINEQNLDGAIILEDDIYLHDNFGEIVLESIKECSREYPDTPVLISYEDSPLLLVPRSMRRKGQLLYEGKHDRYTGAYFINAACARNIISDIETNKTHLPIDGYHNYLLGKGIIKYLWCHPTVATQGSCNGKIKTLISTKSNTGLKLKWFFKSNYKRLLYYFR